MKQTNENTNTVETPAEPFCADHAKWQWHSAYLME